MRFVQLTCFPSFFSSSSAFRGVAPNDRLDQRPLLEDSIGAVAGRWVSAENLLAGDVLSTPDGGVSIVSVSVSEKSENVYNLSIAETNTYTVGTGRVWVHNTSDPCWKWVESMLDDRGLTHVQAAKARRFLKKAYEAKNAPVRVGDPPRPGPCIGFAGCFSLCPSESLTHTGSGMACEDRDAKAEDVTHCFGSPETTSEINSRYSSSSLNTSVPPLRNAVVNSVRAFSVSPVR